MSLKKLVSLLLILVFTLSLSACQDSNEFSSITLDGVSSEAVSSIPEPEPEPEPIKYLNTLTGELSLGSAEDTNKKPVAITINNLRVAQKVQCSLDRADVVFETEVEGGITRLLALFADPSDVEKIGTIRSLRVVFADIAAGMNAMLFYHGIDEDYCSPHLKTLGLSSHQLGYKTDSFREKNGLAYEHRLYTTGEMIDGVIKSKKMKDEGDGEVWLNFRDEAEKLAPSETAADKITVPFSSSYTTQFIYDAELQKYARARKGVEYTDLLSGNRELFTNVFVLETSISYYDDGYHRKVALEGGDGYYASLGGVVPIKWEKGASKNNFKFTLEDGSELKVNTGNSYVCIMSKKKEATFEANEEPVTQ